MRACVARGWVLRTALTCAPAIPQLVAPCGGLPVKLPDTGELEPSLKMIGNGLVQRRALRVARVVEFGLAVGRL
jgi:hypothetical protein